MVRLPYVTALTTLFSYGLLFAFGQLRDFFRRILDAGKSSNLKGYAPICLGLEDFYTRRLYLRIQDCFGRPIASAPDAWFDVVERYSNDSNKTLHCTEKTSKCLNLGSYNYLGFAAADEYCTPQVIESLKKYSASTCSVRVDGGNTKLHVELEELVARFVGKPAAILFGMGYVTNSAIIPALVEKGSLIISDSLNHNSIVNGSRGSGATVRVFQHNNPAHLEEVLREQIAGGQPRTHRPWKKIIVIVEGIYSMEGELCKLPEIIAVCKKYKAYTYLDEAHSIGAVGKSGRGVCELLGVDPADVDIMMGTFTKSFGSCGGYIAASKEIIDHLKHICPAHIYATSMSPPAVQQAISAIKVILGEDGSNRGAKKLSQIRENSNFFRSELQKMGFEVLGDNDSPVMPIMIYNPAKIPAFSRECLRQNVAVVTVAFPAVPLLLARARICISASHSREDLIKGLEVISKVGDLVGIKYFPVEHEKTTSVEKLKKLQSAAAVAAAMSSRLQSINQQQKQAASKRRSASSSSSSALHQTLALDPQLPSAATVPYVTAVTTLFSFGLIFGFGHLRDYFRAVLRFFFFAAGGDSPAGTNPKGYAPICVGAEDFYIRRFFRRIQDCFGRPIAGKPDAWFDVVERYSNDSNKTLHRTERTSKCLNLASFNYLGFAAADEYCTPRVIQSLKKYSASTCSSRVDGGNTLLHLELEELVAKFVRKPAAILLAMGYATNSAIIPALIGKGGLIISDALNHNSIASGARASGATIRVFQHNNPAHLEKLLREQIASGQPRTHRAWKKILVIVEGIYSMEGELCKLPEIISVCKKYKAYTYMDEAHSIGAVGKTGRGVCELLGVDTADVDIMMGTLSKSFGSSGGYIAASKEIIQHLKLTCPSHIYGTSMSPPAVQQVISAMKVILGEDGTDRGAKKIAQIRDNSNFFRSELQKMGFEVLGDNDSPVMPFMVYNPAKMPAFSRECLRQNVAVVPVGFPATPLLLGRIRICISASHSREDLIKGLEVISNVGDLVGIKYLSAEQEETTSVEKPKKLQ
uniref:serine C-palmitoyltransferase n=1 Tax=Leersia perrieri TaxID=77586 RepID=A0A0D9V9U5_9ORYZ